MLLSRLPITAPDLPDRPSPAPTPLTLTRRLAPQWPEGPRCEAWLHAIALLPEAAHYRVMVVGGGSYLPAQAGGG